MNHAVNDFPNVFDCDLGDGEFSASRRDVADVLLECLMLFPIQDEILVCQLMESAGGLPYDDADSIAFEVMRCLGRDVEDHDCDSIARSWIEAVYHDLGFDLLSDAVEFIRPKTGRVLDEVA